MLQKIKKKLSSLAHTHIFWSLFWFVVFVAGVYVLCDYGPVTGTIILGIALMIISVLIP